MFRWPEFPGRLREKWVARPGTQAVCTDHHQHVQATSGNLDGFDVRFGRVVPLLS
jgi:hypothetical protein